MSQWQQIPDTKRKRKETQTNTRKTNARTAHDQLSTPCEVIAMLKGHKNTGTKPKTRLKFKSPRKINHKATQNKSNTQSRLRVQCIGEKKICVHVNKVKTFNLFFVRLLLREVVKRRFMFHRFNDIMQYTSAYTDGGETEIYKNHIA